SGHNYSALIKANAVFVNYSAGVISNAYIVSVGSGFSAGSGLSQYASFRVGSDGGASNGIDAYATTSGVTTLAGAMAVMDIAETAIADLDAIRADIGSVQNQLTVTINNITVTQVNLKSAESTIRDVDFASESSNYSKTSILAQSGTYALAQANASQQNVLSLLQ
ncbi:flagellin, partial [Campylobacter sp. LR291e]|uniref:flagellin n=2 Tax=unclassified Campylobacter TaxID=2593542 RepID=UPI00127A38F0